ncbi:MAG TPA: hypothetical protein VGG85_17305 [Terracidiphilus sp.]
MAEVKAQVMAPDRTPTFRFAIILLALVNLVVLGTRLWPWQNAMNLPGNGTTAVDPAISLAAYVGLGFWIGGVRTSSAKKSLLSAALLGVVAGLFLVGQVVLAARGGISDTAEPDHAQWALLAAGALVLALVGLRTARAGHAIGFCMVCSIWAALVASLMATTAILAEVYFANGQAADTADPWKQYEGLAIGTPAMQAFVQSLDTITAFLLIGPIIACIAGGIFANFGKPSKA